MEHLEVWEHIQRHREPTLHLEVQQEPPVMDTLVHLEPDTQLLDLVIQLQVQATQHILSQATQHSLAVILLSLSTHLPQEAILLEEQEFTRLLQGAPEVILLQLGPILPLQGLILLLLADTRPHLALHIPPSEVVHVLAFFVVIQKSGNE